MLQGPAASTRQRTALGDISNRGYNQLKDGKGGKVRDPAAPPLARRPGGRACVGQSTRA